MKHLTNIKQTQLKNHAYTSQNLDRVS